MLLTAIRRQLTSCRRAGGGDFAFGTLLCSFFFERIPTLRPHHPIRAAGPREPRMRRWGEFMARGGGGVVNNVYREDFFAHWDQLPIQVEDFPYEGMDYRGDPELPLPAGQEWGPKGKCLLV
jgi:hypothetical protein